MACTPPAIQLVYTVSTEPKNPVDWKVWQPHTPYTWLWGLPWTPVETSSGSPVRPDCTNPKILGVRDGKKASSLVIRHPSTHENILDDSLSISEAEGANLLHADVTIAEELEFDSTDVVPLFKKRKYKVYMGAGLKSDILHPLFSFSDTVVWPNLICKSFMPIKWPDLINLMNSMSPRLGSDGPVDVEGYTKLLG